MNPVRAAEALFENKAHLEVVRGKCAGTKIPFRFSPTEIALSKQNTYAEIGIPGLVAPPIQYVRGASEKLSFEALVDTSDTLRDVRAEYVNPIRALLNIDPELHAPPVVKLVWGSPWFTPGQNAEEEAKQRPPNAKKVYEFVGVMESLNVTYTLFAPTGVPLRAKLSIALKEWTTVEEQAKRFRKNSPDVEKTYVVKRGDTLSRIAELTYDDPQEWRRIARANDIADPRQLTVGQVLTIPRIQ
jgi:Contractile injection system tube protein/LysM domain